MTTADQFLDFQNPLWPDDRYMSETDMEAKARAASMERAISPGYRVCQIDETVIHKEDPSVHPHPYDELMAWRHSHIDPNTGAIIADGDPWTYWMLYDQWAEYVKGQALPPPAPNPPIDWNARVRIKPNGIPQMDGFTASSYSGPSLLGYTIVTRTPPATPASVTVQGGTSTRVTLSGFFQTVEAYISRAAALNSFVSLDPLHRLTVGGNPIFTLNGQVQCDSLPYGIDGSTGFLFTAHVSAAPAQVGYRNVETGWAAKTRPAGNWTTQLDKSGPEWTAATQAVLGLVMLEGYYPTSP